STSSNSSACVVASGVMVPSKRDAVRDQAMLVRLAFEALTEVGMSNPNQSLGTFRDGFSLQVDDSVLGDDVHHVRAGCGDDVARCEVQHDAAAALAALVVGRRQANERLATLRGVGAADELQLSARSTDVAVAVRFGRRLSLQINLRGVVDRDHAVV